jgi:LCP family protein required for cell wall assembly
MVLHLSGDRRSAAIISFPRDMYVPIPGHGKNKINSAYALGGSQLAVRTIEKLLDVRMDHVALVSLAGFVDLTNRLDGVTITNTQEFSSHGFHYPKGEITISGKRAMWFVRERKSLADGDLDRAANQRKVMQAIIAKGLSGDTIANPRKFTSFVSGVAENITVDNTMSDQKMRELALSLRMDPRDVEQVQAPLAGYDTIDGVGSVDVVDRKRLDKLSAAMRADDLDNYLEKARS